MPKHEYIISLLTSELLISDSGLETKLSDEVSPEGADDTWIDVKAARIIDNAN